MNIYSDISKCIKCGHDQISTIYHEEKPAYCFLYIVEEHMHRICKRCNYNWAEKPLDLKLIDATKEKEVQAYAKKSGFVLTEIGKLTLNDIK